MGLLCLWTRGGGCGRWGRGSKGRQEEGAKGEQSSYGITRHRSEPPNGIHNQTEDPVGREDGSPRSSVTQKVKGWKRVFHEISSNTYTRQNRL